MLLDCGRIGPGTRQDNVIDIRSRNVTGKSYVCRFNMAEELDFVGVWGWVICIVRIVVYLVGWDYHKVGTEAI